MILHIFFGKSHITFGCFAQCRFRKINFPLKTIFIMNEKLEVTEKEALRKTAVSGSVLNKRVLNVKETTKKEVQQNWNTPLPLLWPDALYIRCNSKGIVNWEIAPVFRPEELIKRGNYNVIK